MRKTTHKCGMFGILDMYFVFEMVNSGFWMVYLGDVFGIWEWCTWDDEFGIWVMFLGNVCGILEWCTSLYLALPCSIGVGQIDKLTNCCGEQQTLSSPINPRKTRSLAVETVEFCYMHFLLICSSSFLLKKIPIYSRKRGSLVADTV